MQQRVVGPRRVTLRLHQQQIRLRRGNVRLGLIERQLEIAPVDSKQRLARLESAAGPQARRDADDSAADLGRKRHVASRADRAGRDLCRFSARLSDRAAGGSDRSAMSDDIAHNLITGLR